MTTTEKILAKADDIFNLLKGGLIDEIRTKTTSTINSLNSWRNNLTVSFSANHFYWGSEPNVTFPSILKANNIETNRGGAYDPNTGIFTAPSDGSYMFAATVFVSTITGKNADGSDPDFATQAKWHDDMHININCYDANKTPKGNGAGADKIGEMWIGEDGGLIDGDKRKKWHRKSASATAIHYLKKGEKVCLEFQVWDGAEVGDKITMSYNFSGTKLH